MLIKTILSSGLVLMAFTLGAQDVVKIGTSADYEPWTFLDRGQAIGYDIDVVTELCKIQKLKCEIEVQPWKSLMESLRFKKFDIIISGINHTKVRERKLDFSQPYALNQSQIIVKADTPIATICESGCSDLIRGFSKEVEQDDAQSIKTMRAKLAPFVIGTQEKSAQIASLRDLFPDVKKIVGFKDNVQAFDALIAGDIDAVYDSKLSAKPILERMKDKELISLKTYFEGGELGSGVSIGFRKGDSKRIKQFDAALQTLKENGKMKMLSEKWFGTDVTPK